MHSNRIVIAEPGPFFALGSFACRTKFTLKYMMAEDG